MGPCLCGDPYCPHCGDPAAAAIEEAEVWAMERLAKARLAADEYQIVVRAGLAAVKAARKRVKSAVGEAVAESELSYQGMCAHAAELESEIACLRAFKQSVETGSCPHTEDSH
jgi:hypothetical protein